jgi:hypothetical protein
VPHWHPLQIRHSRGTEIRRRYGLDGVQVALGHARADVTDVYAEKSLGLAIRIARQCGQIETGCMFGRARRSLSFRPAVSQRADEAEYGFAVDAVHVVVSGDGGSAVRAGERLSVASRKLVIRERESGRSAPLAEAGSLVLVTPAHRSARRQAVILRRLASPGDVFAGSCGNHRTRRWSARSEIVLIPSSWACLRLIVRV